MTESTLTATETIIALKCLREVLLGSLYLPRHYGTMEQRMAHRLVIASNVSKYLFVIDKFLTGETEARSLDKEAVQAFRLLIGTGEMVVLLSDFETFLVIRLPTHDDPQSVRISFPEHPRNYVPTNRWAVINTDESNPTEFGPPDADGNET
jgi:hypothetical protein